MDGLRGVAICWVILFHSQLADQTIPSAVTHSHVGRLLGSGWLGVDIFFVLSGFLITGILYDSRNVRNRVRTFYARRVLRIFPVYFVILFVLSLGILIAERPSILNWLYLSNFDPVNHRGDIHPFQHFWSLAVEEQYYLLWPFVIFSLSRRAALKFCAALFAISLVGRTALAASGFGSQAYMFTPFHLDGLAIGSSIALLQRENPKILGRVLDWILVPSIAATLTLIALLRGFVVSDPLSLALGIPALSVLSGALIICILEGWGGGILETRFFTSIGRLSYAMYLIHWPLLIGLRRAELIDALPGDQHTIIGVLITAVSIGTVSYLLAFASWHLLEKQFLAMKKYVRFAKPENVDSSDETARA